MTGSSQGPQGPHTFAEKIFGINPYSQDDPQHEMWESNARLTAEEEKVFDTELLKRTPVTPEEWARYAQDGMIGHFDILARRLLIFKFRRAESIAIYEECLTEMMQSMLTRAGETCPPMIPNAPFLSDLRRRYRQRIAAWTAEALKRMREAETTGRVSEHVALAERRLKPDVAKDSKAITEPKNKRGPKANMEFHRAVAEVLNSFGPNWKEHLEQIAGKLAKRKLPPSAAWTKRTPPVQSWVRAVARYPHLVVKKLEYSLGMAAKDMPQKPSETLGNLR